MDCGLNLKEIDFYSWYELDLLCRQAKRKLETGWDYTRHVMAAMGAGDGRPQKIMQLSFDTQKTTRARTTAEDVARIRNKYKKTT